MFTSLRQWLKRLLPRKRLRAIPADWSAPEDWRACIKPMNAPPPPPYAKSEIDLLLKAALRRDHALPPEQPPTGIRSAFYDPPDVRLRVRVLRELATAGERAAFACEALASLLDDPSMVVRQEAARTLSKLGAAGRQRLFAACRHPMAAVAEAAHWGIAAIDAGTEIPSDILLSVLDIDDLGYGRLATLSSLRKRTPDPYLIDAVLERWDNGITPLQRSEFAQLLIAWCAVDRARILPRLVRELEESIEPNLMYLVARLRDIEPAPTETIPALLRLLRIDGVDERLRVEAAWALTRMEAGREPLARALLALLMERPQWLSTHCFQYQGESPFTPWSSFLPMLGEVMLPEDYSRVRTVAAAAVAQNHDPCANQAGRELLAKLDAAGAE